MGPEDLKVILTNLPQHVDPNILVGFETGDDAAVFKLRDDLAVVQTLDFFMPIVDDPRLFGKIAAANAISDVYAMGATPVMALAILGFPVKKLSPSVAREIMLGGTEICQQAQIQLAGGHSIDDTEPKFGLSVTGMVHPDEMWTNSGGKLGDFLVLTKPLGVGAMGSGIKKGALSAADLQVFAETTTFLNKTPALAAKQIGVHAATDVTGFGLLGHTLEMAKGAGLCAELWIDKLPVLQKGRELIEQGVVPGATRRNLQYAAASTDWDASITDIERKIIADPQTSGGLLFAVSAEKKDALIEACNENGTRCATVVGRFVEGSGLRVYRL